MQSIVFERTRWPFLATLPLVYPLVWYVRAKKTFHRWRLGADAKLRTNLFLFDGLSSNCKEIKRGAAKHEALDVLYNYDRKKGHLVDRFWLENMNSQAVRNRRKLGYWLLVEHARQVAQVSGSNTVRLLSIAAGSAESVIDAVCKLREEGVILQVLLVDTRQAALDYAMSIAAKRGVQSNFRVEKVNVIRRMKTFAGNFDPHIVEMLGLLDYFSDKTATGLISEIFQRLLRNGGVLLTCNIIPNPEEPVLTHIVEWEMIYRRPERLVKLLVDGGFRNTELLLEPQKIHGIVVGMKPFQTSQAG